MEMEMGGWCVCGEVGRVSVKSIPLLTGMDLLGYSLFTSYLNIITHI